MFFILTIRNEQETRCIGCYDSLVRAQQHILNNSGDMFEGGYYQYAVIVRVETNRLYPNSTEYNWYRFDVEDLAIEISRPEELCRFTAYIFG